MTHKVGCCKFVYWSIHWIGSTPRITGDHELSIHSIKQTKGPPFARDGYRRFAIISLLYRHRQANDSNLLAAESPEPRRSQVRDLLLPNTVTS
ncbi:MAG: hypothetical protein ABI557_09865 [Aureliella sp.]